MWKSTGAALEAVKSSVVWLIFSNHNFGRVRPDPLQILFEQIIRYLELFELSSKKRAEPMGGNVHAASIGNIEDRIGGAAVFQHKAIDLGINRKVRQANVPRQSGKIPIWAVGHQ